MVAAVLGTLLAVGACAKPTQGPPTGPAAAGRLGVWVDSVPEGAVVRRVAPGSGAEVAGLVPGDLIVAVDEKRLGASEAGDPLLRGPVGSAVVLRVAGPLAAPLRTVTVRRQPVDPATRARLAWRAVLHHPRAAADRLNSFLKTHTEPSEGVRRLLFEPLRSLSGSPHRAQVPALVAQVLEAFPDDPAVLSQAGLILTQAGESGGGLTLLRRARDHRDPGLVLPRGARLDTEASSRWRRALFRMEVGTRSPWELSDAQRWLDEARLLQDLGHGGAVPKSLGLAPVLPPRLVRVLVPDARPERVRLLAGTPSFLASQATLLCFWATWCSPCLQELPHLENWAKLHPQVRVVAVSTDELGAARSVRSTARRLGLQTVEVAHDPALARRLALQALPEWRLYGPNGELQGRQVGYSEAVGLAGLDKALESAAGPSVARTAGALRAGAQLDPAPVVGGLLVWENRLWLAEPGRVPRPVGTAPVPSALAGRPEQLGWAGGPVVAEGHLLRAWTHDGRPRWMRTLPGRVTDLVSTPERLWVTTTAGFASVGEDGTVDWRPGAGLAAGAATPEGTLLTAGKEGVVAWRLGSSGWVPTVETVEHAVAVAGSGAWAGASVEALVSAPGWTGVQTRQGVVLVVDDEGMVLGRVDSDEALGPLVVFDADGDGRLDLVVAVPGAGVVSFAVQVEHLDGTLHQDVQR